MDGLWFENAAGGMCVAVGGSDVMGMVMLAAEVLEVSGVVVISERSMGALAVVPAEGRVVVLAGGGVVVLSRGGVAVFLSREVVELMIGRVEV